MFSTAPGQVLRISARLPDRCRSGNGRPTLNTSSSWQAICKDTDIHDNRQLLIHISVLLTILVLIFGRVDAFIWLLGFFALGLESTLPLPQFIRLVALLFKHYTLLNPD